MKCLFDSQKRDIYPLELIKTSMELVWNTRTIKINHYEAIRPMLFYYLQELPDGFLPVNREYKPIGVPYYGKYVKYEDFPFLLIPKDMVKLNFTLNGRGFIFNDICFPGNRDHKKAYFRSILLTIPKLNESFVFEDKKI